MGFCILCSPLQYIALSLILGMDYGLDSQYIRHRQLHCYTCVVSTALEAGCQTLLSFKDKDGK